jgi:hypothetical protein
MKKEHKEEFIFTSDEVCEILEKYLKNSGELPVDSHITYGFYKEYEIESDEDFFVITRYKDE